ncbi:MAG: helix-turn-helix domain-containing protein [Proteobacteria bacterium]|nr:helix-turn-helix domain-containing protein [Pseudomonadota bacterium]
MKSEQKIIKELKKSLKQIISLKDLKVDVALESISNMFDFPDLVAGIEYEGLSFRLIIEAVAQNSLPVFKNKISKLKTAAVKHNDIVPVLVARYLSPQRRSLCQDEGICFIDLSGNVHIKFKSFYVEKIGFPNKFPEERIGRDPFSDKASLILRAILKSGERLWGVRELAQPTNLNPGYVSRMAQELERRNYITRVNSKLKLRDPEGILDDWIRSYSLRKNKTFRYFFMAASSADVIEGLRGLEIPDNINYALGVQGGASLVAPYAVFKEVHIYVGNKKSLAYFEKQLNLREAEQGANLVLMLPYYKHSVFYDSRIVQGLRVVSDIQLYLDLYRYPFRGLEQAGHLFDKKLKDIFARPDSQ